jgi:uroporphyrin-3 C-methyltransferase
VAETSLQRTQIEELIQSLARSRDENVLADVEAAIRVAMQQGAITGSAEPLVLTLQAGRRAPGALQPAAPGTRAPRRGAGPGPRTRRRRHRRAAADHPLDEVIRQVDELPLLSVADRARPQAAAAADAPARRSAAASRACGLGRALGGPGSGGLSTTRLGRGRSWCA